MSLLGVESLVYGADDLDKSIGFYEDFGLAVERRGNAGAEFRLAEGSSIVIRGSDDPALPSRFSKLPGIREIVWGVDSPASLDAIEANLATDRSVIRDSNGTLHTTDDQGVAIGFKVFDRKPPVCSDSPANPPGNVQRWNRHRKWYERARPQLIHHAVFGVPDVDKAVAFYTGRLGFRISDVSRGLGVFLRCDGRNDHHNLFFLQSRVLGTDGVAWHHVSFGVENIDELMTGADYMQLRGWESDLGIGRHRIASSIFYYVKNPAGGMSEYSADTDYLTDDWKPRLWEPMFGNWMWVGKYPHGIEAMPARDVTVLEPPIPSFSELSRPRN